MSFAFPADAAVFGVFDKYTTFGEFPADTVGGGEVAALASGLAVSDELFDFRIVGACSRGVTESFELDCVVIGHDRKNAVKGGEKILNGGDVAAAEFAFIHGGVGFSHEIENGGEGLSGVEIVGEAGFKIVLGPGDTLDETGLDTVGKFGGFQAAGEIAQAFDGAGGLLQTVEGEIQLPAIRNAGERETQSGRLMPFGEQIEESEEIAEGLGHLLAFDQKVLGGKPVADERLGGGAFALGNFIFVMRKGEVDSAGVDVDGVAEILHGHGGAFDVPAGAAGTDFGFPEMLAGFGSFPEGEVAGAFFFVTIVVDASAGLDATEIDFRKLAVFRKFRDAVVDRAFAGVGERLLLEALDELDHIGNVVGGANPVLGSFDVEHFAVVEKGLSEFFGVFADAHAGSGGVGDDAIVHVRQIHDVGELVAGRFEEAAQNILKHESAV